MLDRPSIAVKKSVVMRVGALLAMMAMLVISSPAPNGIFAHPHDAGVPHGHTGVAPDTDDHIHIHYAENGDGEVRDFDSTDPEGSTIEWNVRGVDAADFDIDSSTGVLTFMETPDYENPTDRGLNLNPGTTGDRDNDFEDPGEFDPIDNNYQITVSATEMSDALPAKRTDIALTVIVGNEDDTGAVTLQWLQPEVGTAIRATLTDPDTETDPVGSITGTSVWTWYTSKVADPEVGTDFHWNEIAENLVTAGTPAATVSSYTPQAVDVGKHLRVKVVYTDPQSETVQRTEYDKSLNPVRAEVASNVNVSPDFEDTADTRTVPESTPVGDPVGDPVTATDTTNDTLTYELDDNLTFDDALVALSDLQFFDIDQASGQITVAQQLDYDAIGEGRADDGTATAGEYTVVVRATDPSGEADNITVTITAENVNEDPIVTGRAELRVKEQNGTVYMALPDAPVVQPSTPGSQNYEPNEYVFVEPDHLDSFESWHLEGDDAAAFDLSGGFEPRYIQLTEPPDFENPTDMNRDNVYEVTLVTTDTNPLGTGAGVGRVKIWLIVDNVNEDGKVVFTEGETAYLDQMLVAEVQDPDDHGGLDDMGEPYGEPYEGVHIVTWQWSRAGDNKDDTVFLPIPDATTNRYTPKDSDRGNYLRATATYTDPLSDSDITTTEADERIATGDTQDTVYSLRTVSMTTKDAVRVAPGLEAAPTFPEAVNGQVTRKVAEDAYVAEEDMGPGKVKVGKPVVAEPGNTGDTLTYTLDGPDKDHFEIDGVTGQIRVMGVVGMGMMIFDYEDPTKPNTYRVTVKVAVVDGAGNQKAEVDVVISVTDVNEPPIIKDADGDVLMSPVHAESHAEVKDGAPNTDAVATYVAEDPEGDTISWDLRGADAALFTIDGGVLKFREAPDFENPRDMDGDLTDGDHSPIDDDGFDDTVTPDATASNNMYDVVIRAIASRDSDDTGPAGTADAPVTVEVMNVDEKGEVVIEWLQPEVDIVIGASLTDPDGPNPIVPQQLVWQVSEIELASLDVDNDGHWGNPGNTSAAEYTPHADDVGKYLRVTATYTDGYGNGDKTVKAMSVNPVQAVDLGAKNQSPDFGDAKVDLSVAETAEVGDEVDDPVEATVRATSDTDILTYSLRPVAPDDLNEITGVTLPSGTGTEPADDAAAFDIHKATGQITVAQPLDFESRGAENDRDGKYVVVVEVTDPTGLGDKIVVVITAEDMNERPVLRGRPELTINEIVGSPNAANPDFEGNADPPTVNVYNVDDEDDRASVGSWDLVGDDAGEFQLIGEVGRTLVFTNQPDYENPADADGDNVYKVTVVAIDNKGARGEFKVCIAVMNIAEEGKITLVDENGDEVDQPRIQGPITAVLTDPDGVVTDVTWRWRTYENDPSTDNSPTTLTYPAPNADREIDGDSYTPMDDDETLFLEVTAKYKDGEQAIGTDAQTEAGPTKYAVLKAVDEKRPPAFDADGVDREIAENSPSTTYVGDPIVAAVDPDKGTTLVYTLAGDDADHFELATRMVDHDDDATTDDVPVNTRQIRVKAPAPVAVVVDGEGTYPTLDLNHENDKKNSYEVVLKASDGALDDKVTVTITVTDRNEAPSTPMAKSGAVTPPGAKQRT